MRLFCDMDGVLADFDAGYEQRLGVKLEPRDYRRDWTDEDWAPVRALGDFFRKLPPMPDMWKLWNFIEPYEPTILTGVPRELDASANQKLEWIAATLGAHVPVICCPSSEKSLHSSPGDILIDDWEKHRSKWEKAGGIWVTHTDAASTIVKLRALELF